MRLVGGSPGFVLYPYAMAGAIKGFVGVALGLLIARLAWAFVGLQVADSEVLSLSLDISKFISFGLIFTLLVLGVITGALSSYLAAKRYTDV